MKATAFVSTPRTLRDAVVFALVTMLLFFSSGVDAFEWSTGGRPEVTRQAIAGLWKLTPQPSYPLKEFTVYPKLTTTQQHDEKQELLLMLKEDGSFQQYSSDKDDDDDDDENVVDVDNEWSQFLQQTEKEQQTKGQSASAAEPTKSSNHHEKDKGTASAETTELTHELVKGVWDFRDGKLILAADRPEDRLNDNRPKEKALQELEDQRNKRPSQRKHLDKLIVGRVVATYETSLRDNPVVSLQQQQNSSSSSSDSEEATTPTQPMAVSESDDAATSADVTKEQSTPTESSLSSDHLDAHLNIPKASLKVGKFFYPKTHPSFFEQPIYNPTTVFNRRFQLQQVLGALNTAKADAPEETQPLFERWHFYNKTFLLSSHPLRMRQAPTAQPDDAPWMARNNQGRKADESINPYAESSPIRVMQMKFFPNNTFASVWGTGHNILRGRFDTLKEGTQLWMQILRFGFGRSVKGSCYSEGPTLTHEDAKTYWGTIRQVNVTSSAKDETNDEAENINISNDKDNTGKNDDDSVSILEVEGSVLFGMGLEPTPVGRFLMREMMREDLLDDDDEDEDDDDDDLMDVSTLTALFEKDGSEDTTTSRNKGGENNHDDDDDGLDSWPSFGDDDGDAFQ